MTASDNSAEIETLNTASVPGNLESEAQSSSCGHDIPTSLHTCSSSKGCSRGARRHNSTGNVTDDRKLPSVRFHRQSSLKLKTNKNPNSQDESTDYALKAYASQIIMNSPLSLLNATGKRVPQLLARDLSLASIPVSPTPKKFDDIITESARQRRRRRANDVRPRPMLNVSFGASDSEPSIQYFQTPESCISDDEYSLCFYSKADLERFDKDRSLTVLMYHTQNDKGITWEEKEYTLRGLEEYVDRKTRNRRQHLKDHVRAVLAEQDRLKAAGIPINNSEYIRDVSLQISKNDASRAIAIGNKDAKEIGLGSSTRRLLMQKFKNLSNGSLWRITLTEPVETMKSYVNDSAKEMV